MRPALLVRRILFCRARLSRRYFNPPQKNVELKKLGMQDMRRNAHNRIEPFKRFVSPVFRRGNVAEKATGKVNEYTVVVNVYLQAEGMG